MTKGAIDRLLHNGKCLFLAYDQGLEHGPTDFNDENVTIYYLGLFKKAASFQLNGLPQQVVNLSNTTAEIEFMLVENQTYALSNPQTGEQNYYLITGKNDSTITLDANHPLADKTLDFVVTVIGIKHDNQTLGNTT